MQDSVLSPRYRWLVVGCPTFSKWARESGPNKVSDRKAQGWPLQTPSLNPKDLFVTLCTTSVYFSAASCSASLDSWVSWGERGEGGYWWLSRDQRGVKSVWHKRNNEHKHTVRAACLTRCSPSSNVVDLLHFWLGPNLNSNLSLRVCEGCQTKRVTKKRCTCRGRETEAKAGRHRREAIDLVLSDFWFLIFGFAFLNFYDFEGVLLFAKWWIWRLIGDCNIVKTLWKRWKHVLESRDLIGEYFEPVQNRPEQLLLCFWQPPQTTINTRLFPFDTMVCI